MTDRITGMILLLLALTYGYAGSTYTSDFLTDPLGPTAFPVMLGTLLGIFSLYLLFKPDPKPKWPAAVQARHQVIAVVSLVVYGAVLDFIGFIVGSVILVGFLAWLMGASRIQALVTGVGASIGLYCLFNYFLALPLPTGEIFGG